MKSRTTRVAAMALTLGIAAGAVPRAQAPAPAAKFEVESVKPNKDGGPSSVRVTPGGMLSVTNNTLRNIIRNAWNITNDQIVGGPAWIDSDRFDITAKASGPFGQDEARKMLQALLADRFGLVTRNETRELSVYLLVRARKDGALGPQMKKSDLDCAALFASVTAGAKMPDRLPNGNLPCGISVRAAQGLVVGSPASMEQVARNLVGGVGRIVVDKTGLEGYYDFTLNFAPEAPPQPGAPAGPAPDATAPSLFTAMQEQLGLKLEPGRAPIQVLVIDRAERPAAD
ncbi:MAG TPA: TIGR03435 family protein [Vicinamibacterales bacterium]|nr:TIGR03435 family protein [Vicinamibacterales bacterium]